MLQNVTSLFRNGAPELVESGSKIVTAGFDLRGTGTHAKCEAIAALPQQDIEPQTVNPSDLVALNIAPKADKVVLGW